MGRVRRHLWWVAASLGVACASSGARRFYASSELSRREGLEGLTIAPGPWPEIPAVLTHASVVPDDLIIPTLHALLALPGAVDACDASTGRPRPEASEYCVAIYRTPSDWRVSWPVRNTVKSAGSCHPPFGGVDDADYGNDLPVLGYAHNHPCASDVSNQDLSTWPMVKSEGAWVVVAYGTTPGGRLARDERGQVIPAWGWLATGHRDAPRFYKWNQEGQVYRWDGGRKQWNFQARCTPRPSSMFRPEGVLPDCSAALHP
ncbi:hypothetical protein D7V97_34580 [Corallococcus sp. CA053C]|nr:hypothetical protein D7V97_34580 [Corallococcus sp. CA053C]